ncbi:ATR-interacting protein [Oryzias melastigma]|uniref:ATR interacting protein n=1 Tax=Oryzias melastigma TaxID=30732 RepID=A0A3B3BMT1_ORYME|nr:ATR-interacting protein [Oryzias melastigma]
MNCPPSKRLRGSELDGLTSHDDPFGDEEEFTQDDLDELDIIASQAVTSTAKGPESRPSTAVCASSSSSTRRQDAASEWSRRRGQPGNTLENFGSDRDDTVRLLETQQAELKRKLKEVEEEILLKSGEIRVLRDSLKTAQQEKEAQRQNQILLETQRQNEQSQREKELSRKVQSLQTELQFKEAEINEMKTKLVSSERNKMASPLAVNSLAAVHHGSGSSSSSPVGNGVFTKEGFAVRTSSRMTAVQTPVKARRSDRGACSSRCADTQEPALPDPFLSIKPARLEHRGGVLLGLLLQQPPMLGSFGLSHLLTLNLRDSSQLQDDVQLCSDLRPAVTAGEAGSFTAAGSLAQSLAATGLSLLSRSPAGSRACPGAVLLLPLLDVYLSELVSLRSSCSDSSSDYLSARCLGPSSAGKKRRHEDVSVCSLSLEDAGLTALRILRVLLTHSDEVVQAVLLKENSKTEANHTAAQVALCSQNAVLQSLVRLCESSSHKKQLVDSVMKTLRVLIERTSQEHSGRLERVLQAVCVRVSTSSQVQTLSLCVTVLASLSDHQILARQLSWQHDPCVFLKLFHFIRTRPDGQAAQSDWTLLDLQVVTLLSRLTQGAGTWRADAQSNCQCNTQLVQTVVILLHRQWLDLRCSQESPESTCVRQNTASCLPRRHRVAVSLLRECLLLLHWLLLHHSSFSESCRPLLHMYDQMIPAMRNNLKNILNLSESEEVALEDLCRSEGDDTDDLHANG